MCQFLWLLIMLHLHSCMKINELNKTFGTNSPLNEHLTLTFEALKAFVNVCLAANQKFFVALSNAVRDLVFVLMYEGRTCVVFQMRVDWLRRAEGQSYFCTFSKVTASDGRKPVHTHTHTRQGQHNSSQITVYLTHCLISLLVYCVCTHYYCERYTPHSAQNLRI